MNAINTVAAALGYGLAMLFALMVFVPLVIGVREAWLLGWAKFWATVMDR